MNVCMNTEDMKAVTFNDMAHLSYIHGMRRMTQMNCSHSLRISKTFLQITELIYKKYSYSRFF